MFGMTFSRIAGGVVLLGLCVGCGSSESHTAIVRGKITAGGKPVPNGSILFIPASGTAASGEIQPDGTYTLTTFKEGDGAVPGKFQVIVVAMEDDSNALPEDRKLFPTTLVPIKYTSIATTDLKAVVEDKENTINFDLKE